MPVPILTTKLYIPPPRPNAVVRQPLLDQLEAGLAQGRKLSLISAPAGFGKTTLVSDWVSRCQRSVAWLSLDEGDSDFSRFLSHFVATLQTISSEMGAGVSGLMQAPQPPSLDVILTTLLNDIAGTPTPILLVLDDYHMLDSRPADKTLTFLLDHLPPHFHLVITTREDPNLPLSRLRARAQLTELRATDLRFTSEEAAAFLNQIMGLNLTEADVSALEARTEGWIAGLQLAAISMQRQTDPSQFIASFTGSHQFVMDYLLEEVLHQQPEEVQTFLLRTSILKRLSGPLCDALLLADEGTGQKTLTYLQQANLFIMPLDNQREWYRYLHLFADLLRQRLQLSLATATNAEGVTMADLHQRASRWYQANGLDVDAFRHAVAADDIDSAARLVVGQGMPLHFRGAVLPVLNWLASLPHQELNARPVLWVMYASVLSMTGQLTQVEDKLQAAEAALPTGEPDEETRNLIGHIAAIRALLAVTENKIETIITQSNRALAYLHPHNLAVRTATIWKLGIAYQLQGDRTAAAQAYEEASAISQKTDNLIINISASTGLGNVQRSQNQLHLAAKTYQRVLELVGDQLQPSASEAYLGLARIHYQWNNLPTAEKYAQQSLTLARKLESNDQYAASQVFMAHLQMAQGAVAEAATRLAEATSLVNQYAFGYLVSALPAVQLLLHLQQGNLSAARQLAEAGGNPLNLARVHLAEGDSATALALLEPAREEMDAKGWADQYLNIIILQALAQYQAKDRAKAEALLAEALGLAMPGGFIRLFLDQGRPMADLIGLVAAKGVMPDYTAKLLTTFESEGLPPHPTPSLTPQPLIEPLSERELEVLHLIAEGLSNREIGERLFLALSTVKGHNRNIFDKLQVQRRTEAVARARELGLL